MSIIKSSLEVKDWFFIMAISLLGLALRLQMQHLMNWSIDSDEAIVGLMGKHIVEGGDIPTFYYGQHYMGSLEPLLAAYLFKFFGISVYALRAVPLFFYLLLFPLIYLFGLAINNKVTARIATILLALSPMSFIEWSFRARGGFIEIVFLSFLALYLTVLWIKGRRGFGVTLAIGIVTGLGWWTNNQIVFAMCPIGLAFIFILVKTPVHLIKHAGFGMSGFLFGSLPYWKYNIEKDFPSLGMFAFSEEIGRNFYGFIQASLPIILGTERFWSAEEIFPGSYIIGFGIYAIICAVVVFKIAKNFLDHKVKEGSVVLLLFSFILTAFTIFVVSVFGSLYNAPRYLLPVYPAIYLLSGYALSLSKSRVLQSAAIVSIVCLNLSSTYLGGVRTPGEPFVFMKERAQRDHHELIKWLLARNISLVKTNYWIGYRLAFETNEKVKFLLFGDPYQPRIAEYELLEDSQHSSKIPYLLTAKQSELVKDGLLKAGYSFESDNISGYTLISNVTPKYKIDELKNITDYIVHADLNKDMASLIHDNNANTRWGTGIHQNKGQSIDIVFSQVEKIKAIEIELGKWRTDYPRALEIQCIDPKNQMLEVLSEAGQKSIAYVSGADHFKIEFEAMSCTKLIFKQNGYDPVFDWSIAELRVYK